jgi:hypothetical protein
MICRSCGARIAEKAIICYRCGAPTAEPAAPRLATRSGRVRGVVIVAVLTAAAVAAGVLAHACSLV